MNQLLKMKLSEIKLIPKNPQSSFIIPKHVIDAASLAGKAEGREIYSASFHYEGEVYIFFNKDENGLSAYLIVKEITWNNRDVAVIIRTWTRDDLHKKGYLSGLIKFLRDNFKLSIMSDEEQTPYARDFWKSLEKRFDVKTADLTKNIIIPKISDEELYSLKAPTSYRLFLEAKGFKKQITEWVEPIIPSYIYFEDGDY